MLKETYARRVSDSPSEAAATEQPPVPDGKSLTLYERAGPGDGFAAPLLELARRRGRWQRQNSRLERVEVARIGAE